MLHFQRGENCLWLPPADADPAHSGPLPLLLFLHGIGERGWGGGDLPLVGRWGLPKLLAGNDAPALSLPYPVVAPQCPGDARWCDPPVLAALGRLLDRLVEDGEADAQRLVVAGFSMGGIGAFCLGLQSPHRFAALVSVCGACEEPDRLEELAHLPQWIAWAEDDEIERLSAGSREVVARLQRYGNLIAKPYRLGPLGEEGAHVRTADAAYVEPALHQWLARVLSVD